MDLADKSGCKPENSNVIIPQQTNFAQAESIPLTM